MSFVGKNQIICAIVLIGNIFIISCKNDHTSRESKFHQDSLANVFFQEAEKLYDMDNYSSAIASYKEAAILYRILLDSVKLSNMHNNIGLCFFNMGDYDSAIHFYNTSLQINRRLKDSLRWAGRLRNIGMTYRSMGHFALAIDYYIDSKEIVDNIQDVSVRTLRNAGAINTAIGNIYLDQDNFKAALGYFQNALDYYTQISDSNRISIGYNNMGSAYGGLDMLDSSELYYTEALRINQQFENKNYEAFSRHNLGLMNQRRGDFDKAEANLFIAYNIRKNAGDSRNLAVTANELGGLFINKRDFIKAQYYLDRALDYAKNRGNRTILMDNYRLQADYFRAKDEYSKAYNNLKLWSSLRDSLFNNEKLEVSKRQSKYALNQKENQRLAEKQRADIEKHRANNRLKIIWGVTCFAIMLSILSITILFQRRKIESLNRALRFVNRDMFHRKRNDYTRILNTLESMGFHFVDTIRNMLYASTAVDESLYQEVDHTIDLKSYLDELLEDLSEAMMLSAKGIQLKTKIDSISIDGERASKIAFIISELVTNSVKHSFKSSTGKIKLSVKNKANKIEILYVDNGEPFKEHIDEKRGMGSLLIQGFINMLGGSISRSLISNDNTINLTLPVKGIN